MWWWPALHVSRRSARRTARRAGRPVEGAPRAPRLTALSPTRCLRGVRGRGRVRGRVRGRARVCLIVMCGGQDADGKPLRLYSEEFSKQFLYPSYPKNNAAYGCACITQAIAVSCGPFSGSGAARSAQPKYYCFILCSDRQQKHFIGSELMGVGTSLIPY